MPATYATPAAARPRAGGRARSRAPRLLRGLLTAVGVTLACVLLFALLMQWLRPSDTVVRVVNPAHQAGFHLRGRLGHERPRKRPGPHVGALCWG